MSKSFQISYVSLVLLLGVLIFSLSSLPGFSKTVTSGEFNLSSACDFDTALGSTDTATCNYNPQVINGQKVRGTLTVKTDKRVIPPPPRRWSDDPNTATIQNTQPQDVLDIEIHTEAECTTGCENGVRPGEVITESIPKAALKNARDINDFLNGKFTAAALATAAKNKQEADRQAQIDQCLMNESGNPIPAQNRLSCRMDKFSQLVDDTQKEDYFEKNLKGDLQTMVRDGSPAQRAQAMQMLQNLNQQSGSSTFLQESISELYKFGQAHQIADQLLTMPANDTRRAGLMQQWTQAQQYFAARGMEVNSQYATALSSLQLQDLDSDLASYQASLDAIANEHLQMITNNTATTTTPTTAPAQTRPGMVSAGQGRLTQGQAVTSYIGMPGVLTPGTGTGTSVGGRPGVSQPSTGRPLGPSRGGIPVLGAPVR